MCTYVRSVGRWFVRKSTFHRIEWKWLCINMKRATVSHNDGIVSYRAVVVLCVFLLSLVEFPYSTQNQNAYRSGSKCVSVSVRVCVCAFTLYSIVRRQPVTQRARNRNKRQEKKTETKSSEQNEWKSIILSKNIACDEYRANEYLLFLFVLLSSTLDKLICMSTCVSVFVAELFGRTLKSHSLNVRHYY